MRVLQGVVVLFAISILVFVIVRLTGDPRDVLLPPEATQEDYERLGKILGLDKSLPVQYGIFIMNIAKGDFGMSIRAKRPVSELLLKRLPNSVKLSGFAMVIAFFLSLSLGVTAAAKKGSGIDTLVKVFCILGMAVPHFWLGIMFILFFSVELRLFPSSGTGGIQYYILPGVTIGWSASTAMMRLLRSSMLEVLDTEYVKLARIKGVSESWVIWRHALRNALIPMVTFGGFYFATAIGTAVIVETIFAWPGLGRLAYEALVWRDFPVIQGVVLLITAIVVITNLVVDILYVCLDPRVRY